MKHNKVLLTVFLSLLNAVCCYAQVFDWVQTGYASGNVQAGDGQINSITHLNNGILFTGKFTNTIAFGSQTLTTSRTDAVLGKISVAGQIQSLQQSNINPDPAQTGYAEGKISCSDRLGNIYIAYYINANAQFGQTFVAASGPTVVIIKYSSLGNVIWTRKIKASGDIELGGVAVDSNLNCILAISFNGVLNIDNRLYTSTFTSYNSPDGLLVSVDSAGSFSWANQLIGSIGRVLTGVCVDSNNGIYVAGHFDNQIVLGPATNFTSSGLGHLFLAKYDNVGQLQWAQKMGSNNVDVISAITADNLNNVVICGSYGNIGSGRGTSSAAFGNVVLHTLGNDGFADGFVAKYNSTGNQQWVKPFQGPAYEGAFALCTSRTGDIFISGSATYGSTFGPFTIAVGNGSDDGFVAKYNSQGNEQWVVGFGGPYPDYDAGTALACDDQGHVYVAGSYVERATFGYLLGYGLRTLSTPFVAQLTDIQVLSTKPFNVSQIRISLFPNPSNGLVTLQWPVEIKPNNLKIHNLAGLLVYDTTIDSAQSSKQLDLSNLSLGIYVISLVTPGLVSFKTKLVIN